MQLSAWGPCDALLQIGPLAMQMVADASLNAVLAQLVLNVQAGDQHAFGQLYDLTSRRIAQVVTRTLRVPEHTAEVLQDVYLYAWEHAHSFDPARGTLLSWLTTLAHRRAVDRVRHVERAAARDQRHAADQEAETPDASVLGLARLDAARLHAALRRLSPKQRQAVVLIYLHGWTFSEAANRLSVPVGTLKTRARAGLGGLRLDYTASNSPC